MLTKLIICYILKKLELVTPVLKCYIFLFGGYFICLWCIIEISQKEDFFMITDPIRSQQQLKDLAGYWLKRGNFRNYTLIVLGVYTALRISDLLNLQWSDVYDFKTETFRSHITVTERKTGKQKIIALHKKAINALRLCLSNKQDDYVFSNNRKDAAPISRVQAWRIVKLAAQAIEVAGCIACHSLRKTFGYFAWKSGVLPVILMDIYNHSSFDITRKYLGIAQDDRDRVYLSMALL